MKQDMCMGEETYTVEAYFDVKAESKADENAAVITGKANNVRFTVLSERLIRMEYTVDGIFEDRASQTFFTRKQPVPAFSVKADAEGNCCEIRTDYLTLCYQDSADGFTGQTLTIAQHDGMFTWHYGDSNDENLWGTARTLDRTDGEIPLEEGLVSRLGWSVVDDSQTLVFDENCWVAPRYQDVLHRNMTKDLYFFGFGHDYKAAVQTFTKLSGEIPTIPKWALGNWWSRYYRYTDQELLALMDAFTERHIPLSVCIVDMDWHVTENPNHRGWTGYTWDTKYFPDHISFLKQLRERNLKTALNLHPAEGVHCHEAQYETMAKRMKISPETKEPVYFDIADKRFANAYFQCLHHPMEAEGVDFWWMDWQQGGRTQMEGLDPLWMLNHLHFYDLNRNDDKRPFIFSRWGGLGNHRYPIGFSGDTRASWDSLRFQPYFTATAANVAYGWWSHDIGGHMRGNGDEELYARWVQFGVFSPVLRLHSCNDLFAERRPWGFDENTYQAAKRAMTLRHKLIPYIYSASDQLRREGLTLIRPLYYDFPEEENAYRYKNEYWFGEQLLVAPVTTQIQKDTACAREYVWFPAGLWFHFMTGACYEGDCVRPVYSGLYDIPVFAKAGAIIPLAKKVETAAYENGDVFDIKVFPGADGAFTLYEDDGQTMAFEKGGYAKTQMTQTVRADERRKEAYPEPESKAIFTIHPTSGDLSLLPEQRTFHIELMNAAVSNVKVFVNGKPLSLKDTGTVSQEGNVYTVSFCPTDELRLEYDYRVVTARETDFAEAAFAAISRFSVEEMWMDLLYDRIEEIAERPETLLQMQDWLSHGQLQMLYDMAMMRKS